MKIAAVKMLKLILTRTMMLNHLMRQRKTMSLMIIMMMQNMRCEQPQIKENANNHNLDMPRAFLFHGPPGCGKQNHTLCSQKQTCNLTNF